MAASLISLSSHSSFKDDSSMSAGNDRRSRTETGAVL